MNYAAELGLPWLRSSDVVDIGGQGIVERAGDLGDAVVIVGGGGLGFSGFQENLRQIAVCRPRVLIWWGAGRNVHFGKGIHGSMADEFERLPQSSFDFPTVLHRHYFDLIGVRDADVRSCAPPGYQWVPCVSAMHPAFDVPIQRTDEVRVYSHKDPMYCFDGEIPVLTNATSPVYHVAAPGENSAVDPMSTPAAGVAGAAIRFIRSAGVLITNSYHGAYWALLAGVPVAVFAEFSTKFRQLPFRVPIVTADEVRKDREAVAHAAVRVFDSQRGTRATLLELARSANIEFAAQVQALARDKGFGL
jgi:hypothetical protein